MQDFYVLQHKELKNQCDYLKRQWQVWRGLINRIGHGYDPISGTFDWPEEIWENIIAVNSEAMKYKTAPLQHRDLLEKLFEGLSATEDFAWSSGMISVHSSTQQSEYVPLVGVDYPWDGEVIPSYDASISPLREPTPGSTSRSRTPAPQSNRRRSVAAVQPLEPGELVQSLISAFTAQGESSTSSTSNDDPSTKVANLLKDMVSSYEIDNTLFFKKPISRTVQQPVARGDDESRVEGEDDGLNESNEGQCNYGSQSEDDGEEGEDNEIEERRNPTLKLSLSGQIKNPLGTDLLQFLSGEDSNDSGDYEEPHAKPHEPDGEGRTHNEVQERDLQVQSLKTELFLKSNHYLEKNVTLESAILNSERTIEALQKKRSSVRSELQKVIDLLR
ncbi:hypothetical protein GIB67_038635 [Kingdonia uniflora]|uniref:Myb/SANT-like domain-containing protein n=1 Tax=Kingdonia uniflora TaxID=39325 RepID=A0A7J7NQD3_9MAGN|nr:hypothetical protein GIB67_038635 [Kingdonia uniflora]